MPQDVILSSPQLSTPLVFKNAVQQTGEAIDHVNVDGLLVAVAAEAYLDTGDQIKSLVTDYTQKTDDIKEVQQGLDGIQGVDETASPYPTWATQDNLTRAQLTNQLSQQLHFDMSQFCSHAMITWSLSPTATLNSQQVNYPPIQVGVDKTMVGPALVNQLTSPGLYQTTDGAVFYVDTSAAYGPYTGFIGRRWVTYDPKTPDPTNDGTLLPSLDSASEEDFAGWISKLQSQIDTLAQQAQTDQTVMQQKTGDLQKFIEFATNGDQARFTKLLALLRNFT